MNCGDNSYPIGFIFFNCFCTKKAGRYSTYIRGLYIVLCAYEYVLDLEMPRDQLLSKTLFICYTTTNDNLRLFLH